LVEVVAPGRLTAWLGVEGKTAKSSIAWFGARELLAGGMLLRGPAVVDERLEPVFGDGMDLGRSASRSAAAPAGLPSPGRLGL